MTLKARSFALATTARLLPASPRPRMNANRRKFSVANPVGVRPYFVLRSSAACTSTQRFSSAAAISVGNDSEATTTAQNVSITKSSGVIQAHTKIAAAASAPSTSDTELVDGLLERTSELVDMSASNNIAYSGGVDSSLSAALVYEVFTNRQKINGNSNTSKSGNVRAVLGLSPAVPEEQVHTARKVAEKIGIELLEIETKEGNDSTYIANAGRACLACKTHLYSALEAVADAAMSPVEGDAKTDSPRRVVLYNGTNADDTRDPTRLGLVAASNFRVESPLLYTTKADVRRAAKHLGLPNWDYAAAPCLRSRLAFGVEATRKHLQVVGEAERRVRAALDLDHTTNLRVRMLAKKRAMVELDEDILLAKDASNVLEREGFLDVFQELGFRSYGVRSFKSGAVAAVVS